MVAMAPSIAHAGAYNWETGCYNALQRCWATNFDPNAGNLGSASRTDNFDSLPTWNGQISYGSKAVINGVLDPLPGAGGDYPRGGGNAYSASDCAAASWPSNVSCNYSPSQFVTQNYTDSGGAWHFAMGGGSQCRANGGSVPCNLGHAFHPYDCSGAYSVYCTSTAPQGMPFTWGFPSSMTFDVATNFYVGSMTGYWHGFLCANLVNRNTSPQQRYEICEETFSSTGLHSPPNGRIDCPPNAGSGLTVYWQRGLAGSNNTTNYMTTYSQSTNTSAGVNVNSHWRMTRQQFINLITDASAKCGRPAHFEMDDWKLYYSENGFETFGPSATGAGISWQESDETMTTNY